MSPRLSLVLLFAIFAAISARFQAANAEDDDGLDSDLDEEVNEADVLVLGKANFTEALKTYEYLMVRLCRSSLHSTQRLRTAALLTATCCSPVAQLALEMVASVCP